MAALEHELTDRLGLTFERRGDVREVASVAAALVERWSSRRAEVLAGYDQRSAELGRAATPKERSDVLRSVTLQTRAPKVKDGHVGLHERWADEAAELGVDWSAVSTPVAVTRADELDRSEVIEAALDELQSGRAQWSYSHLSKTIALYADRALDPISCASSPARPFGRSASSTCRLPTSGTWRCGGDVTARASTATRSASGIPRST
jgi:hypothetical protein